MFSNRDATLGCMELITLADAPPYDPDRIVAQPFVDGQKSNVRVIRLGPARLSHLTPTATPT